MPIPVVCESCNAKLNAPDAAAGKSLKCPKCKGAITVPDPAAPQFEVVVEEPAAPPPKAAKLASPAKKKPVVVEEDDEDEKPKSKKKPVLIEEDDEDEDEKPKSRKKRVVVEEDEEDEDDQPRKKKKKKKVVSAVDSGNMARTIIGIVVLLIALGFAAYVWWDRSKEKEKDEKTENSGPPSQTQQPPPGNFPQPPGPPKQGGQSGPPGLADNFKAIASLKRFKVDSAGEVAKVQEIFLTPDGTKIGLSARKGFDSTVQLWDVTAAPQLIHKHPGRIDALSPDGNRYASGEKIVEFDTGKTVGTMSKTGSHIYFRSATSVISLRRSNDWSVAKPCTIHEYESPSGKEIGSFEGANDDRVHIAAPVNDNKVLFLGVEKANTVRILDLDSKNLLREFKPAGGKPNPSWSGFTVSPDGKWVAMQRSGDPVEVFDARNGALLNTLPQQVWTYEAHFPLGRSFYLAPSNIARDGRGNPFEIAGYDLNRKSVVASFTGHEKSDLKTAVSANGKLMATGDEGGNVLLWDLSKLD